MHIKIKLFSIIFFSSMLVTSANASKEEIQSLIQQGTFEKALALTEAQLSKNPDETQILFLKGLILAKMDRLKESATVFIGLTEKHPELPEPYNNLAVVYAASGDYDKAEEALRRAINTHPSYATAHENLGDIYAKMASQAYNNALKLDSNNIETKEKLSMINDLISAPKPVIAAKNTAIARAVPEPRPQRNSKPVATKPPTQKATKPALARFEPEPTTILKPPYDHQAATKDVETAVNVWANAWSKKDVDQYVKSYARTFVPPFKLSRSQWEKQRHERLNKPKFIKVSLENIKIRIKGEDLATVNFIQHYESDNYKDQVNKQLLLSKTNGRWLISKEKSSLID